MIVFERLKSLCKEQGTSIVELEEELGFGKNSLYGWKKKVPNGSNLEKVANYFNVSIDYLVGRAERKSCFYEKNEFSNTSVLNEIFASEDLDSALAVFERTNLEKLNEEDKNIIMASWENTIRLTKYIALKKCNTERLK